MYRQLACRKIVYTGRRGGGVGGGGGYIRYVNWVSYLGERIFEEGGYIRGGRINGILRYYIL